LLCHEIPDHEIFGVDVKVDPAEIDDVVDALKAIKLDTPTTLLLTCVFAASPTHVGIVPDTTFATLVKGR
jgi:hypothetical protein